MRRWKEIGARWFVVALAAVASLGATPAWGDCGDIYTMVLYPADGATQVPTNARILTSGDAKNVVLSYDETPSTSVPGEIVPISEFVSTFVPVSPLQPNKAMTVAVPFRLPVHFETGSAADSAGPVFAGVSGLRMAKGTVQQQPGGPRPAGVLPDGGGCGSGSILSNGWRPADEGSVYDLFELDFVEATDDTAPPDVLIYRVYTYPDGGDPGAAVAIGMGASVVKASACGVAGECWPEDPGPFPTFDLVVGQTACVKVEVEDPAGNVTLQEGETCAVVDPWRVSGFCELIASTAPDGGIPGRGMDSGVEDASADVAALVSSDGAPPSPANGQVGIEGPTEGGCSCEVTPRAGGWLWLLAGLLLFRRRRTQGSHNATNGWPQ